MNRRAFILSAAICAASCGAPVFAKTVADEVEADLVRKGYTITSSQRTFLGRIKINAAKGRKRREVVVDPASGEVLRDYSDISGEENSGTSSAASAGASGNTAGDDEDDDDDVDEEANDDDEETNDDEEATNDDDEEEESDRPVDSERSKKRGRPSDGNVD